MSKDTLVTAAVSAAAAAAVTLLARRMLSETSPTPKDVSLVTASFPAVTTDLVMPNLKAGNLAEESRRSFALPASYFAGLSAYRDVITMVADNRKIGPFKATSGVVLPYYLNLSTNFMDKKVAQQIVQLMVQALKAVVLPRMKPQSTILLAGPEMAGGVLAAQLATDPIGSSLDIDYFYIRKNRKKSGTLQQLEGAKHITERTSLSPSIDCVWVDDCISTGSSAAEGIAMLKKDYNINVKAMLFLVDRSTDRKNISDAKLKSMFGHFRDVALYSIYDLSHVVKAVSALKA